MIQRIDAGPRRILRLSLPAWASSVSIAANTSRVWVSMSAPAVSGTWPAR